MPATQFALDNYVVEHHPGDDILWITFDHAGLPKHRAESRLGWAVSELTHHGWEVLAIKARAADWFLKPDIAAYFQSRQFLDIASGKRRIILYGLSMGAFGALAFSTMIKGSVVLAISPQSTLDPEKVPWEKRFDYALGEDWTGPMGDLNTLEPAHAEAYIIYSPAQKFDGPHVERLDRFGPLTLLPLIGNAHVPGGLLMEGGLLKALVREVAAGPIDASIFDKLQDNLTQSASYHYFLGSEATDPTIRSEAMAKCLELAHPNKLEYYRQRVAGFLMRAAAKQRDSHEALIHYKALRKCEAWRESIGLKMMAARYLVRAGALGPVEALFDEISARNPEGHRKLADVHRLYEDAKLKRALLEEASNDEPTAERVQNG